MINQLEIKNKNCSYKSDNCKMCMLHTVKMISTGNSHSIRSAFCDDALYKLTFTFTITATQVTDSPTETKELKGGSEKHTYLENSHTDDGQIKLEPCNTYTDYWCTLCPQKMRLT